MNQWERSAPFFLYCPLRALFTYIFYLQMTTQTSYAQMNNLVLSGRVFNAEIVSGANGDFLAVSIISTLMKDGPELVVTFTDSNGIKALYEKGWLPKGRQVTVTGHIADTKFVYTAKDGTCRTLKRPELKLVNAQFPEGGLGAMPKSEASNTIVAGTVVASGAPVDAAPTYVAAGPGQEVEF